MKLSVLLPTRNRADYLRYAARTVLEQDDPDLELVISDNASEDETAEVCRALDDPRVRYVRTDRPLPVSENWQNALEHASGDYVIMLGDDDALLRGYCRITRSIIERFERPELIYHGGYQFAYPGVLPDAPDGHLVGPHRYAIFGDSTGPVRLDARLAREQVQASLRFRMQIGYNMQYSTISRELIERLRPHGPFFDSPYPDFFATNVAFLTARAIVVDPRPLVAIGICPRSFGAYFFSDRESEGIEMLMNEPDDASRQRLARVVLPGLQHYTSWLFAMQRLVDRYGDAYGLRVDYRRYRLLQIGHAYARLRRGAPDARERLRELQQRLSPLERWGYAIAYGLLAPLLRRGGSLARSVRRLLRSRVGPYPEIEVAVRPTPHRDILSLFRALPAPDKADSAGAPAVAAANDPVGEPGATPHAS